MIISCGFDAARGDPLGHYDVTPSGYAHMTHLLTSLAEGKVVIALEVHMMVQFPLVTYIPGTVALVHHSFILKVMQVRGLVLG